MARNLRVKAIIEAENRSGAAVDQAQGGFSRLTNFLKSSFVITLGDVVRATRAVVDAFASVINASAEEEAAINALRAALAPLGAEADKVTKALVEQATALQNTTAFSDDAILAGQQLAATFTRSEEQLKAITQAAVDLAASGRIDLQAAFTLLGRAATGATETLGRYGIKVDESASNSEKFAQALTQINAQVGGQAIAQLDTFSGSVAALRNAFGEAIQVFGDAIVKNDQLRESLQSVTDLLRSPEFADAAAGFLSAIVTAVSTANRLFQDLVNSISGAALILGSFAADVAELNLRFENTRAVAAQVATELVRGSAAQTTHGAAAAAAAPKIDAARTAQEKQIAAARLAPDPLNAAAAAMKLTGEIAAQAVADQEAYVRSLDGIAESATDAAEALDGLRAAGEAQQGQAADAAFSVVGGIRQVGSRARTDADTEAALLQRNIEALGAASGLVGAGVRINLQRRLAQLQAADFGETDDTRSLP